jgi:2-polyprenyl-6-methoxyphenol hydroxylase-like FAD-dependent oxidoreductase
MGGSISLGPNALQVLDRYAGVYDRVSAAGFTYRRFGAYFDDGEKFGDIAVGEESKGEDGYPSVRILRMALHKVLLEAAEESGMIDVRFGKRFLSIEEDEEGVTVYFDDGDSARGKQDLMRLSHPCSLLVTDLPTAHMLPGDILIGADGMHSKVRQHVLGPAAPTPSFDGLCIVYGFVPTSLTACSPKASSPNASSPNASSPNTSSPDVAFPAMMFTASGVLMAIPVEPDSTTLAWVINKNLEERDREGWKELEQSGQAARVAKADYSDIDSQPVRSLLDNADDTKARLWAAYSIPPLSSWHTSRVCLIGDAAHGLPPHGGQGSAMAFEDGAILVRLLDAQGSRPYSELFDRLQALRMPRVEKYRERSGSVGGSLKRKTGPWVWYLKKLAIRGFFWWNNGVLDHAKEYAYDVDKVDLGL